MLAWLKAGSVDYLADVGDSNDDLLAAADLHVPANSRSHSDSDSTPILGL